MPTLLKAIFDFLHKRKLRLIDLFLSREFNFTRTDIDVANNIESIDRKELLNLARIAMVWCRPGIRGCCSYACRKVASAVVL